MSSPEMDGKVESAPSVLVVDKDPATRAAMVRVLGQQGYEVDSSAGPAAAMVKLSNHFFHLVLLELADDSNRRGRNLLAEISARWPEMPCIVLTSQANVEDAFQALNMGAYDYFEKPIEDWTRFGQVLKKALEIRHFKERQERLQEVQRRIRGRAGEPGLDAIIGKSKAIESLRQRIVRFAASRAPVLVTGESGTGKELVAHAIHKSSPWNDRPFLDVNCAAIPRDLLESELFGHEQGAFSGAHRRKLGLFEVAEDGTVFLDEIGELPMELQAKLLRVLETGDFRRLGGTRTIGARFRVVSATNRDLAAMSARGEFRQDLHYRLDVVNLHVPPLRERAEDIPLLTLHFVVKYNKIYGKQVRRVPKAVMRHLESLEWKENNVRQLQHVIHRAMLLTEGESLELDTALGAATPRSEPIPLSAECIEGSTQVLPEYLMTLPYRDFKAHVLESLSKAYIGQRLRESGGNIAEAARLSGQDRPNFKKLMKKYGIKVQQGRILMGRGSSTQARRFPGQQSPRRR